jgi:hypothetical protein
LPDRQYSGITNNSIAPLLIPAKLKGIDDSVDLPQLPFACLKIKNDPAGMGTRLRMAARQQHSPRRLSLSATQDEMS